MTTSMNDMIWTVTTNALDEKRNAFDAFMDQTPRG